MTDQSIELTLTNGDNDPLRLLDGVPLSDKEDAYVRSARAVPTLRGYRSDWREFRAGAASTTLRRCRPPR